MASLHDSFYLREAAITYDCFLFGISSLLSERYVGHVFVDGKDVSSGIIREGNFGPIKREGMKIKDGKLRPFTFAKLNLTGGRSLGLDMWRQC